MLSLSLTGYHCKLCHKNQRPVEAITEPSEEASEHTVLWNQYAVGLDIVTLPGSTISWLWAETALPLNLVAGTRPAPLAESAEDGREGLGGFVGVPNAGQSAAVRSSFSNRRLQQLKDAIGIHDVAEVEAQPCV
jgi:hypothetical protein